MKTESVIAIAGLATTLIGTLGGIWLTNNLNARRQAAKAKDDAESAAANFMNELLLAAITFRAKSQVIRARWNDAASLWLKFTGARRAVRELETVCGPARDHLLRVALEISRWQAPERQAVSHAAGKLLDASAELSEALGRPRPSFVRATQEYEDALRDVRRAIDAWDAQHAVAEVGRFRAVQGWVRAAAGGLRRLGRRRQGGGRSRSS